MFKKPVILLIIIISTFAYLVFSTNPKVVNIPVNLTTFRSVVPKAFNKDVTILLTGDIMLGRSVMGVSLARKNPNYPFEKVVEVIKSSDIVFGNLENPIIADCPQSDSDFKFCADPKMAWGLSYAGIDIVNLANNHTGDYGENGIAQTEGYLKNANIDYVGTDNLVIRNINGIKFGFLGFNFIENKPKDSDYQLIKNSKKEVDILIVMVHWGVEYTSKPTVTQKTIANDLVSAGVDVIAGNHPHWIQDIDYINGKPIFYSLGNFVFDQPWSEETKNGLVIRLIYQRNKLLRIEELPIYMRNFSQPEWAN